MIGSYRTLRDVCTDFVEVYQEGQRVASAFLVNKTGDLSGMGLGQLPFTYVVLMNVAEHMQGNGVGNVLFDTIQERYNPAILAASSPTYGYYRLHEQHAARHGYDCFHRQMEQQDLKWQK